MIRRLVAHSVQNPVAVNLAMLAVVLAGLAAFFGMPREVFPEFSLKTIQIEAAFPGAAPEDVERLVTQPLEEQLEGLDGVDEMHSRSQEGLSWITLELEADADVASVVEEARAGVTGGDVELPEDVDDPRVREVKSEFPVIAVFVYGEADAEQLRLVAEEEQRILEQIPGVSHVALSGAREPRVWVEVDPEALERFGLTLASVGAAVGARAVDTPLGSLSTASGDYLLRAEAGVERAADLRDLPVLADPDGRIVRLGEVARVRDTYERPVTLARFNGRPCIYLQVNKRSSGDLIDIAAAVRDHVASAGPNLPAGIRLGTNSDLSIYVKNRLAVMRDSGTLGGLLVLVSLILFLNVRVALMTALGIPVAFLGGLLLASLMGTSMNMITMFALIVVLGMVVDDAIVVGENVYRKMEEGVPSVRAAIQGTAEVAKPVLATILTTCAAFLPLLALGGIIGKFMRPLPLIVSFCLLASLAEALFVMPSHLAHWSGHVERAAARESGAGRRWYGPLQAAYVRVLRLAVRHRLVTVAAALVVTALFIGVAVYRIPFTLFDEFESKVFYVNLRTPSATSMEVTADRTASVEAEISRLPDEELESTNMLAGISFQDATQFTRGANLGQVWVELREDSNGRRPTAEIIEDLRERFSTPPAGVESVDIAQPQAGPSGKAIDISLRGPDLVVLRELAGEVAEFLAGEPGVRDIHDSAEPGKREVRVTLTEEGRLLGLTEAVLGAELRAAFEGTRFARVRRDSDDVEIVIKYPEQLRFDRGALDRVRITTPLGRRVPLSSVAEVHESSGQAVIQRDNGQRSVRVFADVNKREGNAGRTLGRLVAHFEDLPRRHPGVSLVLLGDAKESRESLADLSLSAVVALTVIYLILGTLFRSYTQPLVIMFAIPLAAGGLVAGHLIMGRMLSLMSLIGGLALAGIVVNDSLILVDFVNVRRRAGESLERALVEAGRLRFRPILLTTLTTMLGLSPLTFFASGQARFLQPMAISVFFGLAAATALTLVVVPCGYGLLYDGLALLAAPRRVLADLWRGRPLCHPPLSPDPEPET